MFQTLLYIANTKNFPDKLSKNLVFKSQFYGMELKIIFSNIIVITNNNKTLFFATYLNEVRIIGI